MTAPADTNPLREALAQARSVLMEQCLPWVRHSGPRQGTTHGKIDDVVAVIDAALASEPVAGTVRDTLAVAYLLGRGMSQSSIDDVREYGGETWLNALDEVASLSAPAPGGREEIARVVLQARGYDLAVEQKWAAKDHAVSTALVCDAFIIADAVLALGPAVTPQAGATTASAPESLRAILGAFYKTVDVMKSARNKPGHTMCIWADDMKAVEDVMLFLEELRDATSPAPGAADRAVAFCEWLQGYFKGDAAAAGKDELTAHEANTIRGTLNEMVFPPTAPANTGETGR